MSWRLSMYNRVTNFLRNTFQDRFRRYLIISLIILGIVIAFTSQGTSSTGEGFEVHFFHIPGCSSCLGSVAPTPIEIKEIRKKMVGKNFDQLDFTKLGQIVEDKISPIDDIRGTREYRKDVAKEIMINALEEIDSAYGGCKNE